MRLFHSLVLKTSSSALAIGRRNLTQPFTTARSLYKAKHDMASTAAHKLVVVGGVAGGASAAARFRRLNERAHIVVFEKGPDPSFANCGMPYHIGEVLSCVACAQFVICYFFLQMRR